MKNNGQLDSFFQLFSKDWKYIRLYAVLCWASILIPVLTGLYKNGIGYVFLYTTIVLVIISQTRLIQQDSLYSTTAFMNTKPVSPVTRAAGKLFSWYVIFILPCAVLFFLNICLSGFSLNFMDAILIFCHIHHSLFVLFFLFFIIASLFRKLPSALLVIFAIPISLVLLNDLIYMGFGGSTAGFNVTNALLWLFINQNTHNYLLDSRHLLAQIFFSCTMLMAFFIAAVHRNRKIVLWAFLVLIPVFFIQNYLNVNFLQKPERFYESNTRLARTNAEFTRKSDFFSSVVSNRSSFIVMPKGTEQASTHAYKDSYATKRYKNILSLDLTMESAGHVFLHKVFFPQLTYNNHIVPYLVNGDAKQIIRGNDITRTSFIFSFNSYSYSAMTIPFKFFLFKSSEKVVTQEWIGNSRLYLLKDQNIKDLLPGFQVINE
jgi:hypothetical protein